MLVACAIEPLEETLVEPYSVETLWEADPAIGDVVTIGPMLVTSGRTTDQRVFFASSPEGGLRSGVMIALGAVLDDWPPDIGTEIVITGTVLRNNPGPILELLSDADGVILDERSGPAAHLWSEDPLEQADLTYALVTAPDLTVTSRPDPLGEADTDGSVAVGGRFGVSPGYGRTGDLRGIVEEGRISARAASDWSGLLEGAPAVEVSLAELPDLPEGAPVIVDDLVLATPWSRDNRWALAQDAQGRGVWLDGQGFGLQERVVMGQVGRWTGEVRYQTDGLTLRVWEDPLPLGVRAPLVGSEIADGALAEIPLSTLGAPNPYGERPSGALWLDDRFLDLSALQAPLVVRGAVRVRTDGVIWLAPIEILP